MSGAKPPRDPFDDTTPPEDGEPYDASNKAAIKKMSGKARRMAEERKVFMFAILQQPTGRKWLAHVLFDLCGMFGPTENAAFDTNSLHFKEGARAVGILLNKEALLADREQYMVMLSEHLTAG